jgi:hypothetical protein
MCNLKIWIAEIQSIHARGWEMFDPESYDLYRDEFAKLECAKSVWVIECKRPKRGHHWVLSTSHFPFVYKDAAEKTAASSRIANRRWQYRVVCHVRGLSSEGDCGESPEMRVRSSGSHWWLKIGCGENRLDRRAQMARAR